MVSEYTLLSSSSEIAAKRKYEKGIWKRVTEKECRRCHEVKKVEEYSQYMSGARRYHRKICRTCEYEQAKKSKQKRKIINRKRLVRKCLSCDNEFNPKYQNKYIRICDDCKRRRELSDKASAETLSRDKRRVNNGN